MQVPGPQRDRHTVGLYISEDPHDLTPSEPTYYRIRALELRELEAREPRLSGGIWAGALQDMVWISTDGLPNGADGAVIVPEAGDRIVFGRGKVIGYDGETEFFGPAREVHVVAPLDPAERVAAVHWTAVLKPRPNPTQPKNP
jgi:hypothetical protein